MSSEPTGSLAHTGTTQVFRLEPQERTVKILGDNGIPLVTLHPDGQLEYGPDYDPDEAARRFWDAMRHYMPARCERCGHVPGAEASCRS